MADDASNLFGLDVDGDDSLNGFIPNSASRSNSSSAPVDVTSNPPDDIDLSGDDLSRSFFSSATNWNFDGSPSYDTYDPVSTAPTTQPSYVAASWPPFAFDPNQSSVLNGIATANVDPISVFGGPPPSSSPPKPRSSRGPRLTATNVPRTMTTTLTPAVQEQLRNIAMPPHLQYNSPKSASSPDSATGEGKSGTRSSSDGSDPSRAKKRKMAAELDNDEDEDEEDCEGGPVKKTSHNMIEKRYRNNLNDKIAALRDSVPSLRIMSKSARGEDTTGDREELHGLTPAHKLNKATVCITSLR